jgi:hypothetical protein
MDRPLLTFGWIFLAVGLCIGAWSLATPLGAAPDEPEHLVQAAAVVRGQFDGPQVPVHYGPLSLGKIGTVRVPAWVTDITDPTGVSLDSPICKTASSCQIGTPLGLSSTRTITSATQFSNYPPLYYLIVGGPTLLATGTGALYGVRLLGVLLDSLLIALGLYLLVRYHGRPVLIGALTALTPSVLFFGSVVNSSGVEIAAGFAAWCAGLCIVAAEEVSRPLIVLTSSAFAVLILCRPTSWVTALVILLVLGVLGGWQHSRQLVGRLRPLWTTLILALAVAGSFLLIVGTPTLLGIKEHPPLSLEGSVRLTLRLMGGQLRQTIGVFGWLDVPAPTWVIALWVVAIVALVVYALAVSQRARRALPLLALTVFAYPFLFETSQLNTVGPYWQGRYWLPLALGLPLVAAAVLPPLKRSWVVGVGILLAGAQLGAFLSTLNVYKGHPVRPGSAALWAPPGGVALTIALFTLGQVLLVSLVWARWNEPTAGRSGVRPTDLPAGGRGRPQAHARGLGSGGADGKTPQPSPHYVSKEADQTRFPTATSFRSMPGLIGMVPPVGTRHHCTP